MNIIIGGKKVQEFSTPRIPKVIFQISKFRQPQYVIDMIMHHSPSWEYKQFNDNECRQFLLDNSPEMMELYNKLLNGEHRADLFRYCYLYKHGGVYIDSDAVITDNIDNIIKDYDFVTIKGKMYEKCVFNGFITALPGCPIMYKAIQNFNEINIESLKSDYHLLCNNLYKIIYDNKWDLKIKIYNEEINWNAKISYSIYDDNTRFLTHYYGDKYIPLPPGLSTKRSKKSIQNTKIGVTFNTPKDRLGIFTNGIRQNAMYFYTLLANIGYDVYLIVNDSVLHADLIKSVFDFVNAPIVKCIDYHDIGQQIELDIIFQVSLELNIDSLVFLRKCGVKLVAYKCGNEYLIEMENALFKTIDKATIYVREKPLFDQVWTIPQHTNSNFYYWKTLHRCECIEVPFIWSPKTIENLENGLILEGGNNNFQYRNRGGVKKIAIFEPNLNVVKWAYPAVLVCENSYRSIPEKIGKVLVTNVDAKFSANLTKLVKPLNLFKDNKISAESRYNTLYFMSHHADVAVSHQWENPLNYLYLDLAWMGWPIVHNAHLCKDIGYFYEEFNYENGGKILTDVILNHDKTADDYKRRNRKLIDRYLPTNKELQRKYIEHVEYLLS